MATAPATVRRRRAIDTVRIRLTLAAPSATPWQADTLWGHLCWAIARRHGEAALRDFLAGYARGEPVLVLSDGFPAGRLPRPLLPPPALPAGDRRAAILAARAGKATAGSLVDVDAFLALCRDEPIPPRTADATLPTERRALALHNQIDRASNTTGGEAGTLFTLPVFPLPVVDVYARVAEGREGWLRGLLDDLRVEGYGKRRAVGYGAIADLALDQEERLDGPAGADAFVSLSRFVPAAGDPADGMWRTAVKFGRVGGETATPLKRPLVMLTPGSWFRTPGPPRPWYGRIVPNVSPAHPNVVQYGLAFAMPMRAPAEAPV